MDIFFDYILVALVYSGTALAFLRGLHMFQLNGYKIDKHLKWLVKNPAKSWSQIAMFIFLYTILLWRYLDSRILDSLQGIPPIGFPKDNLAFISQPAASQIFVWLFQACFFAAFVIGAISPFINLPLFKAKKPLLYTPRVWRMVAAFSLILLGFTVHAVLSAEKTASFLIWILFLYIFTPLLPIVVSFINLPIEELIRRWFKKDAQRLLQSCGHLEIIGITGSYGKTSVKFFLTELLNSRYETLMTPESYNTPMGICKTIRGELRGIHQFFVCEMGLSHVGDIEELCDFVKPKHGIITAVGDQHLATMKTRENILCEKLALARAVTHGMLFVNGDCDKLFENKPLNAKSYGLGESNDCFAYAISVSLKGTVFSVNLGGEVFENLSTPLIGSHNVCNLVGAIAMARAFGVSEKDIRARLKRLSPPPHRLELKGGGNAVIIDDAFNSNPEGAKAALETLAMFGGCKILITPGMVELGAAQYSANFELGKQAAAVCDYVFAVGEKQAQPILAGLQAAGYPPEKTFSAKTFNEAIAKAQEIPCQGEKIILLENDLPDNY
ncbi:MAG: UDP-N-acetylmuramoyl-tripeptide--D-alanyl-D-alanine ligase [Oscillospiraceae bacterium]|nr:UDP-N-acetylmuramoyl-tripeptide--D-alanyl-D-alanine ligase [Oscillospiraceae bacterium]